ncbi:MAG: MFS transporter [Notoacmeibacter sp.]|nr:MFS transporter [Notoacmeibacter sp.]MCC0033471.1 MFS transporter [Brucellaceae bacterium]
MTEQGETRVSRKGIWGWMFFDWAAQPFFTVVTTFIFGPYFISRLAADPAQGQAAWGYAVAAGGVMIAVLSPVLGSIADQTGPRKPWIGFFAVIKIIALCTLWWAAPGASLFWVALAFTLATVAAEFSIVFNDSMMTGLVPEEEIGKISNTAWGLGYAGGMIVLIFVIALLAASPETGKTIIGAAPLFGIDVSQGEDARATGPIAALWYLVFVLPMFLFTPDQGTRRNAANAVAAGIAELKQTLADLKHRTGIARFLIARMIYQDGVNALLALGGGFAAAMFGWSITEIGIFGIILNIVAIPCSIIAGRFDAAFGAKRIVLFCVVLLLVATIGIVSTGPGYTLFGMLQFGDADSGGLFGTAAEKAYIVFGLLIGAAFGPVQASSRSYMARSVSKEETGRYFGIYALAGRATSFLAPFLVATITAVSGSARAGMAVIAIFFIIGFIVMLAVPKPADNRLSA